jgi:hypothetical protein
MADRCRSGGSAAIAPRALHGLWKVSTAMTSLNLLGVVGRHPEPRARSVVLPISAWHPRSPIRRASTRRPAPALRPARRPCRHWILQQSSEPTLIRRIILARADLYGPGVMREHPRLPARRQFLPQGGWESSYRCWAVPRRASPSGNSPAPPGESCPQALWGRLSNLIRLCWPVS